MLPCVAEELRDKAITHAGVGNDGFAAEHAEGLPCAPGQLVALPLYLEFANASDGDDYLAGLGGAGC